MSPGVMFFKRLAFGPKIDRGGQKPPGCPVNFSQRSPIPLGFGHSARALMQCVAPLILLTRFQRSGQFGGILPLNTRSEWCMLETDPSGFHNAEARIERRKGRGYSPMGYRTGNLVSSHSGAGGAVGRASLSGRRAERRSLVSGSGAHVLSRHRVQPSRMSMSVVIPQPVLRPL